MSIHSAAKYLASIAAVFLVTSLAGAGCNSHEPEGGRCNSGLATGESDCNSGLSCIQPALCPENYCCPADSQGNPTASSNPYCQTGCNGGAASICNAGGDDAGACAFACKNDPSDLADPSVCPSAGDGGGLGDGGAEGGSSDAGTAEDGGADGGAEAGPKDAGGGDAPSDVSNDAPVDSASDAPSDAGADGG